MSFDRTRKRPDAFDLFEHFDDCVGALAKSSSRIHARRVLCDARPHVDPKNFFDEFVLAEVDLDARDRRQDGIEDGSCAGVITGEESFGRSAQVLGHIVRIRMADLTRGVREQLRLLDESW